MTFEELISAIDPINPRRLNKPYRYRTGRPRITRDPRCISLMRIHSRIVAARYYLDLDANMLELLDRMRVGLMACVRAVEDRQVATRSPKTQLCELRRIVGTRDGKLVLECGHLEYPSNKYLAGMRRRRCSQCPRPDYAALVATPVAPPVAQAAPVVQSATVAAVDSEKALDTTSYPV